MQELKKKKIKKYKKNKKWQTPDPEAGEASQSVSQSVLGATGSKELGVKALTSFWSFAGGVVLTRSLSRRDCSMTAVPRAFPNGSGCGGSMAASTPQRTYSSASLGF